MANVKTVFTRSAKVLKKEVRGQAAVVLEGFIAHENGATIEQVAKDISETLVTRQDPERVVAYYACIFKKQGILVASQPAPADEPDTDDGDGDENDSDESDETTDESEDEDETVDA